MNTGRLFKGAIVLAFGVVGNTSIASEGTGTHGGNVVACFKGKMADVIAGRARDYKNQGTNRDPVQADGISAIVAPVELLDLYEKRHAKTLGGVKAVLIANPKDFTTGLIETNSRVMNTNFVFWGKYLSPGTVALPVSSFSQVESGVKDVDDSNEVIKLPGNCLLLQIASQGYVGKSLTVTIDGRLFSLMPTLDQTALITHERILNVTSSEGDMDSNRARKLNGAIYLAEFNPNQARIADADIQDFMLNRPTIECRTDDDCGSRNSGDKWYALNTRGSGIFAQVAGHQGYLGSFEYPDPVVYRGYWFANLDFKNVPTPALLPYEGWLSPKSPRNWIGGMHAKFDANGQIESLFSYETGFEKGTPSDPNYIAIAYVPNSEGRELVRFDVALDFQSFTVAYGGHLPPESQSIQIRTYDKTILCQEAQIRRLAVGYWVDCIVP